MSRRYWQDGPTGDTLPSAWWLVAAVIIAWLLSVGVGSAQGCTSTAPGSGWVCVGGGWLPPGHPGIPTGAPAPPPPSGSHPSLAWQAPLSMGPIETFTPPMILTAQQARVVSGAGKVFRPNSSTYRGPLVIIDGLHAMQAVGLTNHGYPPRFVVEDLMVHGYPGQTCIELRGVNVTIERAIVAGCDDGLRIELAVNVSIRDSLFSANRRGLHIRGNGPQPGTTGVLAGPITVTTVTISSTRIAGSTGPEAVLIGHGLGVLFNDQTIIEGNAGHALVVTPGWPGAAIQKVLLRDTWLEANGGGIVDHVGAVRLEGITGSW